MFTLIRCIGRAAQSRTGHMRIAVLGLYNSGSSALAGMLDDGIEMLSELGGERQARVSYCTVAVTCGESALDSPVVV